MILFWLGVVLIALFGFVLLFGAPYLPTLSAQQKLALDMLDLKKGQTFYDLGCGDGRLLKTAAKRGLVSVGYELNPLLAAYARLNTWRYRSQVRVVCGNFWSADISGADGIFVFLIDHHMKRLDEFVSAQHNQKRLALASYGFSIPGKKTTAKSGPIYLYKF
jgi:SAM-dependent methyltransferase